MIKYYLNSCLFFVTLISTSNIYANEKPNESLAHALSMTNTSISTNRHLDSFRFSPLGELNSPVPVECHPLEFINQSIENHQSAIDFAKSTKEYFNHCERYFIKGNKQGLTGLMLFENVSYRLDENPQIQKTVHTLSDGTKIDALIGVKDLIKKRPWVILKCGVFCDINKSSTSLNFIINLFDQSPFNIIVLSNDTGIKHIQSNETLKLGGYYESYDYFDVANWLRSESPYKNTIDSIHAVGFSLGGAAALGVSYLSHSYNSNYGNNLINSSIAVCPVVNLEPTLKDIYSDSIKGKISVPITWKYLREVAPYLNQAKDYLARKYPPDVGEFPNMLAQISLRYGNAWDAAKPPGRELPILNSLNEFYERNNFSKYINPSVIPTFVWASVDDSVVNFQINTKTLMEQKVPDLNLGALALTEGNHCAFDTSYGYTVTTSILQSFIINNSPNFKSHYMINQLYLPQLSQIKFSNSAVHLRQWWIAKNNSDQLNLVFETFDPLIKSDRKNINCNTVLPLQSPNQCRKLYKQEIPISVFSNLKLLTPQNQTQAEMLSRKLNGFLRVTNNYIPIDGTLLQPLHVTWRTF